MSKLSSDWCSTNTATILDPFQMVATAVHLTQRGFNLYHAHVFEYNKTTDELQIVACGYKEGDEHEGTHGTAHIPLQREQSLVARAARTRKPVIVNDVRSDPDWLPNPLLPETRAELAVPMVVGNELIGVLDVQSEYVDAFNEEDATIQLTLAAQLAVAMKNAQSYSTARDQAKMETLVNAIGQKIQRAGTVEDTLQIAIRELGLALGASRVKARIENPDKAAAQETAS
jgi:GAF domain-containing protein